MNPRPLFYEEIRLLLGGPRRDGRRTNRAMPGVRAGGFARLRPTGKSRRHTRPGQARLGGHRPESTAANGPARGRRETRLGQRPSLPSRACPFSRPTPGQRPLCGLALGEYGSAPSARNRSMAQATGFSLSVPPGFRGLEAAAVAQLAIAGGLRLFCEDG